MIGNVAGVVKILTLTDDDKWTNDSFDRRSTGRRRLIKAIQGHSSVFVRRPTAIVEKLKSATRLVANGETQTVSGNTRPCHTWASYYPATRSFIQQMTSIAISGGIDPGKIPINCCRRSLAKMASKRTRWSSTGVGGDGEIGKPVSKRWRGRKKHAVRECSLS